MRCSFLLTILLMTGIIVTAQAQQSEATNANLKKFAFLIGEWEGEGSGQLGQQGKGYFSFKPDLDGRIIVRKNRAEFPATTKKAAFIHDDLLVIYAEKPGDLSKAILMDNEDHTIHYTITFSEDQRSIIFTSDVTPTAPTFRLSYIQIDANTVNIRFEIAPPGKPDVFNVYLEGKAHRK